MHCLRVSFTRAASVVGVAGSLFAAAPALAQDTEVTVGSRDSFAGLNAFSQNKQNEPGRG